jgi:hypothetical protein
VASPCSLLSVGALDTGGTCGSRSFKANAAGKNVPGVFLPVLVEAKMKPGLAEDTGLAAVNAPHSRTKFRANVRAMSNGSAPGGSGLSYAELKCMNDNTLDLLSDLCNVSVAAGLPPSEWCTEIVYMIPKETGVDAIENNGLSNSRRP